MPICRVHTVIAGRLKWCEKHRCLHARRQHYVNGILPDTPPEMLRAWAIQEAFKEFYDIHPADAATVEMIVLHESEDWPDDGENKC